MGIALIVPNAPLLEFLRIIRSNQMWEVVETSSGTIHCLERLALDKAYRVSRVCKALGCSSRYIHQLFMRDIGLPPKHWMKMERMVVARRKLEGGKLPDEVSKDLGFRSISNFHRQFFKCYEMTAKNFLRRRRVFDPRLQCDLTDTARPRKIKKSSGLPAKTTALADSKKQRKDSQGKTRP